MNAYFKSVVREIKNSFARYMAIFIITALGVGFFAGLRACRPALTDTAGEYFEDQKLYDFRLMSSIGFLREDNYDASPQSGLFNAEGALSEDVLLEYGGSESVIRVHSLTDTVNSPKLISGRMPEADGECVADADYFDENIIGQTLSFSENDEKNNSEAFNISEFTVVGRVRSPLYISTDRGTSSLGGGKPAAFILVKEACFTADYYTELYIALKDGAAAYSEEYKDLISDKKSAVTEFAEEMAQLRYDEIVSKAQNEVDEAREELEKAEEELNSQKEAAVKEAEEQMTAMGMPASSDNPYYTQLLEQIDEAFADAQQELQKGYEELEEAQNEVNGIEAPSVYVLTRSENAGYAAFEQDSCIIENISVVFPVFFFLVAALVCVTTMTRMVEDQRTQIGVLKAMGYGKGTICRKYLFYSGSAGIIGCVLGFFGGTALIPSIFWFAYKTAYNFTDSLLFGFDPVMFTVSLAISVLCTAGATLLCCRKALREVPAAILRPKTPKSGKRILIERFKIWKKVGFLQKVSLRNVMRYKQRFFLMILGISGCTALLLTGFGIRDSIQNVTDYQYGEIVLYDGDVTFSDQLDEKEQKEFSESFGDIENILFLSQCTADITLGNVTKSVSLTAVPKGDTSGFINTRCGDGSVEYPNDGEIILCRGTADSLNAQIGDILTLTSESYRQMTVSVKGVFDNYIGSYIYVSENTMTELCGEAPVNAAYVTFKSEADKSLAAAEIQGNENVSRIALGEDMRNSIETSFASLDLVVLLIILCAGALAFIVLFNLININIGERIREIATIKVLGFFNSESAAYVFREVNLLTAGGALLGLLLGKLLHIFVMEQIKPDGICFDSRIAWSSYLFSVVITLVFALLVQAVMRLKLKKISMAQSLKSVE
ncbi:MAG: FtsX-like permease family protein [Firmicutes bacterium]|nr:FtsX-like permease family protein [[Eubacterium] siraeum]MCM1487854.1 FtsX-like permease family protein [Bacillota bacterium]